jgi:hypothetical protein
MAKCLVEVEVPLEIDYTTLKKTALCKVYFSKDTVTKIECFLNGKHYTPISINDDYLIILKARELFRVGKFKSYTDADTNAVIPPKHNYDADLQKMVPKPKPIPLKVIRNTKNLENIKNYVLKHNGEVSIKNISESLSISPKTVQDVLSRLNYSKIRDMNHKGRGRRFFVHLQN